MVRCVYSRSKADIRAKDTGSSGLIERAAGGSRSSTVAPRYLDAHFDLKVGAIAPGNADVVDDIMCVISCRRTVILLVLRYDAKDVGFHMLNVGLSSR